MGVDRFTEQPKGFAYIEFENDESMWKSLMLDGSLFRGRRLKVVQKRTNVPGFNAKGKGGKGKATNPKGKGKAHCYHYPWVWDRNFCYGYVPMKGHPAYGKWFSPY